MKIYWFVCFFEAEVLVAMAGDLIENLPEHLGPELRGHVDPLSHGGLPTLETLIDQAAGRWIALGSPPEQALVSFHELQGEPLSTNVQSLGLDLIQLQGGEKPIHATTLPIMKNLFRQAIAWQNFIFRITKIRKENFSFFVL